MRQLSLLRHAKSSWDTPAPDRDRPLAERGRRDARLLADWLAASPLEPRLVRHSPALRAAQTVEALRVSLPAADVAADDDLYGASATRLLQRIARFPDDIDSALVVGHNPGLHDLAVALVGNGDAAAWSLLRSKLPTASLVVFVSEAATWADLRQGSARLEAFVRPRDLR